MSSYKNILIFAPVSTSSFSLHKMIDSESTSDIYKLSKVSVEEIIKYPRILKLVPDHLKTKKKCKNAAKKLTFVIT